MNVRRCETCKYWKNPVHGTGYCVESSNLEWVKETMEEVSKTVATFGCALHRVVEDEL